MNRATPGAFAWQRKKRTTLAHEGRRGKARRAEWVKAKAAHLALEPLCQGRHLPGPCGGPLDVHHVIPRGMGGGKDYGQYATLCRNHHEWVEGHREAARALGFLARVPARDDGEQG